MKTIIVKRLKDNMYLSLSEQEAEFTLKREKWDGMQFVKEFIKVGEDKGIEEQMEKLFNE